MKSLSLILVLVFITFLLSCQNEKTSTLVEAIQIKQLDSLSNEKVDLNILKLSSQASKDLESFEDFHNLKSLIHSLHTSNAYYIKKYADSMDLLVQSFKENLSEDLKVNTIRSRIAVLSTESGLLVQSSEKKNADSQKLLNGNIRLLTAYNSLIIQLNELSLAIPENIEKELLRERDILRDSISKDEKAILDLIEK